MKKFVTIASIYCSIIFVLLICLACIKPEVNFTYDTPSVAYVYKDGTSVKSTNSEKPDFINEVDKQLRDALKISMLNHLAKGNSAYPQIGLDTENKHKAYSTSLLDDHYAVAFTFKTEQKQVTRDSSGPKMVEHFGFIIILDPELNYQEAPIYIKTSENGSYKANPMLIKIKAKTIIEFIDSL